MEVNEALTIIQEAAHEDANIIFGAVVDPNLEGRVKITVIATGFDQGMSQKALAATNTPVDLTHYAAPPRSIAMPAPEPMSPGRVVVNVNRRPVIDLPARAYGSSAIARVPASAEVAPAGEAGADSHLDVPSFLRGRTAGR
jgi:cell division protein FtsZ